MSKFQYFFLKIDIHTFIVSAAAQHDLQLMQPNSVNKNLLLYQLSFLENEGNFVDKKMFVYF